MGQSGANPPPVIAPPRISQIRLWACLLAPPTVIVLMGLLGRSDGVGFSTYVCPFTLIVCGVVLSSVLGQRYRGRSLALLMTGYFLGELFICIATWFGMCLATFKM